MFKVQETGPKSKVRLAVETLCITVVAVALAIGVIALIALAKHANFKDFTSKLLASSEFKPLLAASLFLYGMMMTGYCLHYRLKRGHEIK